MPYKSQHTTQSRLHQTMIDLLSKGITYALSRNVKVFTLEFTEYV